MNTDKLEQLNILDLSDDALSLIINQLSVRNIAKIQQTNTTFRDIIKNYHLIDEKFEETFEILDKRNLEIFDKNKIQEFQVKFTETDKTLIFTTKFDKFEVEKFNNRYVLFMHIFNNLIHIFVLIRDTIYIIKSLKNNEILNIDKIAAINDRKVCISDSSNNIYIIYDDFVSTINLSNLSKSDYDLKYYDNKFLIYTASRVDYLFCLFFYQSKIIDFCRFEFTQLIFEEHIQNVIKYNDKNKIVYLNINAFRVQLSSIVFREKFDKQVIMDFYDKFTKVYDKFLKSK
jgi:hypothetical protein